MPPRVSVAITTFNQAAYIGDAVRSVLAQSYADREIVVVDDGSSDETPQVLAEFGEAVHYVRQANRGVAGARNRAVEIARGELVAFLDGDDLWEPTKLAKQVSLYDRYPSVGVVACDVQHFSEARTLWDRSLSWTFFASTDAPHVVGDFYEFFVAENPIATTSQVMIPRAVLDAIGPSRQTFQVASDYDLYLRIARRYPVAFLNEVLTRWRFVETSVSGRADLRMLRWKSDSLEVLRCEASRAPASLVPLIERRIATLEAEVAWSAYDVGCRGSASDRRFARACLRPLVVRGHLRPVAYYAALCLPTRVRSMAQQAMEQLRSTPAGRPQ